MDPIAVRTTLRAVQDEVATTRRFMEELSAAAPDGAFDTTTANLPSPTAIALLFEALEDVNLSNDRKCKRAYDAVLAAKRAAQSLRRATVMVANGYTDEEANLHRLSVMLARTWTEAERRWLTLLPESSPYHPCYREQPQLPAIAASTDEPTAMSLGSQIGWFHSGVQWFLPDEEPPEPQLSCQHQSAALVKKVEADIAASANGVSTSMGGMVWGLDNMDARTARGLACDTRLPVALCAASSLQSPFLFLARWKLGGLYRKLRRKAARYGGAVLVLNQVDAIAERSPAGRLSPAAARALYSFMETAEIAAAHSRVVTVGVTSAPRERIDPALLRSSRLSWHITSSTGSTVRLQY